MRAASFLVYSLLVFSATILCTPNHTLGVAGAGIGLWRGRNPELSEVLTLVIDNKYSNRGKKHGG